MKRTKKSKLELQRTTLSKLKELKRKELEQALGGTGNGPPEFLGTWLWCECPGGCQGCY